MGAPPRDRASRKRYLIVATSAILFSLVWSLLCNLTLEFLQAGGDLGQVWALTLGRYLLPFLLGSALVWCVFLLLWALTGRLRLATALLIAASLLLGYANYKKIVVRLEPLYPSDLGFAGNASFLGHMVGLGTVVALTGAVILVIGTVLLAARILGRHWIRLDRRAERRQWLAVLSVRVVVVALTLTMLGYATRFNDTGNQVRAAYEASGARWAFWFQRLNYFRNGFVGGFLYNTNVPAMTKPAGYSRPAMQAIAARYVDRARALNSHRDAASLAGVNIVVVLSEAFSDPTKVKGVRYEQDPIPFTRELMRGTTSGTMLAQMFGGGTANMEFEALTGMSLSQFTPQMVSPYQMMIPDLGSFPSAVGHAKLEGREPIAVHPYITSMYKRDVVYPILGFEKFVSEDDLTDPVHLDKSDFVADETAFDEVRRQIEDSAKPLLVNLVTMQNHYPMKDLYDDPLPVTGLTGEPKAEAEGYGRGLQYTDSALASFISGLEGSDEPTAVVFYGDHQPGIWPEDVRDENGDLAMRETPFFVWANFETDKLATAPLTSPIYFLPLLYDAVGAPLPPWYALLHDLYQLVPAMEQGIYVDQDGEPHSPEELPARARQLLRDYRMLQYDLSVGDRFTQNVIFKQSPAEQVAEARSPTG